MHPIGQILNVINRREFQNRTAEYMHAPILVDAPILTKMRAVRYVDFIDKYITCDLPNETNIWK